MSKILIVEDEEAIADLEILCRNALAVVLDLHPDGIHLVQNADVDDTLKGRSSEQNFNCGR